MEELEIPEDLSFNSDNEFAEDFLVTLTNEFNKLRRQVFSFKKENEELSRQLLIINNKISSSGY